MKQKLVLKVQMEDAKKRSKALKVVAGFSGVLSATIEGSDKSQIAVVDEGVDPIELARFLRKKMGFTDIVTVAEVKEEKKEEKKETKAMDLIMPSHWPCGLSNPISYGYYPAPVYHNYQDDNSCTIM